jgi:nucleoside 2-deoxyribosyltransferase
MLKLPKSIYVAGSSKERELVAAYQAALRAAGWMLAHDWVAQMNACHIPDVDLPIEAQRRFAEQDLAGVRRAQVFWLIAPSTPSIGAYVELGYALALQGGPRVVVSGLPSLFTSLADVRYDTHAEAFAALTRPGELPAVQGAT